MPTEQQADKTIKRLNKQLDLLPADRCFIIGIKPFNHTSTSIECIFHNFKTKEEYIRHLTRDTLYKYLDAYEILFPALDPNDLNIE